MIGLRKTFGCNSANPTGGERGQEATGEGAGREGREKGYAVRVHILCVKHNRQKYCNSRHTKGRSRF